MIDEFLQSMKPESTEDASIGEKQRILVQFFTECQIPLEDMSSDDVLKWFISFAENQTVGTLELCLNTLSSFFRFYKARDKAE